MAAEDALQVGIAQLIAGQISRAGSLLLGRCARMRRVRPMRRGGGAACCGTVGERAVRGRRSDTEVSLAVQQRLYALCHSGADATAGQRPATSMRQRRAFNIAWIHFAAHRRRKRDGKTCGRRDTAFDRRMKSALRVGRSMPFASNEP